MVRARSLCRREGAACRKSADGVNGDSQTPPCPRRSWLPQTDTHLRTHGKSQGRARTHGITPRWRAHCLAFPLCSGMSSKSFNIPINRFQYPNKPIHPTIPVCLESDTLRAQQDGVHDRSKHCKISYFEVLLPGWNHCASDAVLRQRPSYATFNPVPEGAAAQTCLRSPCVQPHTPTT